jgi:(E)-4-hydroxy-3-methylbut-2-enyl-diphosphate synthase
MRANYAAGAPLIRLTAQAARAENLRNIKHSFATKVIYNSFSRYSLQSRAAKLQPKCGKGSHHPGNFVDKQKTFAQLEYTTKNTSELQKIRVKVVDFLNVCKNMARGTHRCKSRIAFRSHHESYGDTRGW